MISLSFFKRKRRLVGSILFTFTALLAIIVTATQMNTANQSNEAFANTKKPIATVNNKVAPTKKPGIPTPTVTIKPSKPAHDVYIGAWTQGLWNEQTYTLHPEALQSLENKVGKKFAIAHYYRGWENLGKESIVTELNSLSAKGWRPMLSANPYFMGECPQSGENIYKTIASGKCDAFLQKVGTNLKSYGKPVFLRFAWEMNIEAIEWSIQKTNSSPDDYVQAWRRVHDVVAQQGATNVIWVWSPNTISYGSIAYNQLYPGDAYVDWVGLDGYNWGTTQSWTQWQTFDQVFAQSYASITSITPNKPLMIAETNTTDKGGNKPAWYQDALAVQIPYNYPKIKAVVFYNEDRSAKEGVNWLIDISPESLESFSKNINASYYLSSF